MFLHAVKNHLQVNFWWQSSGTDLTVFKIAQPLEQDDS